MKPTNKFTELVHFFTSAEFIALFAAILIFSYA